MAALLTVGVATAIVTISQGGAPTTPTADATGSNGVGGVPGKGVAERRELAAARADRSELRADLGVGPTAGGPSIETAYQREMDRRAERQRVAEEKRQLEAERKAAERRKREAAEKRRQEAEARAKVERKVELRAERARAWRLPTSSYRLTARFAQSGSSWSSGSHTGLDFAAPMGTPVVAVGAGSVISAGWDGAYGNHIEVRHSDDIVTTYSHLSKISRSSGSVEPGDIIGYVGSTGNSTGPHLHFEVRINGSAVDPDAWLADKGDAP